MFNSKVFSPENHFLSLRSGLDAVFPFPAHFCLIYIYIFIYIWPTLLAKTPQGQWWKYFTQLGRAWRMGLENTSNIRSSTEGAGVLISSPRTGAVLRVGRTGHNNVCESPSWLHELEVALLRFEWHKLRKALWGWVCFKYLSAWIILVSAPPNSRCLGQFPLSEWGVYIGQDRLGRGNSSLADSWRKVIVDGIRKSERNGSEEQDMPLSKLPSFTQKPSLGF